MEGEEKRRQKYLSASVKKRAKLAQDAARNRSRIYIKSFAEQWFNIKSTHGLLSDEDTAGYLINW